MFKNENQELPYVCFVEASGLLVVISFSGYCCKFSIEPQEILKNHYKNDEADAKKNLSMSMVQVNNDSPRFNHNTN